MHKNGYTLIEILAAIMIFTMMMSIAVISFRGVSDKDRLKSELVRVAGIIREARTRAYNGVIAPGLSDYPLGGYGVYMNKLNNKIILFADINDNNYYDAGEKISESVLNSRLHFTFKKKIVGPPGPSQNRAVEEQLIIFDGDDYPLAYNQSEGCWDVNDISCFNPPLRSNSNILLQISSATIGTTVGSHANCNGQINVSPKDSAGTIEPLLIDTYLEHC